jgi:[ribosomal protein S18]-alanine N-acetyltransferase
MGGGAGACADRSRPAVNDRAAAVIVVTEAAPNDAAALAVIERDSFSDPWSERSFRELTGRSEVTCLIAREREEIVGYAVVYSVGGEGELANLAVAPPARGRGIGAALLAHALTWARERGAADLWLEVRASNEGARALYQRFQFETAGVRRGYYRAPAEDAIVMRRELSRLATK